MKKVVLILFLFSGYVFGQTTFFGVNKAIDFNKKISGSNNIYAVKMIIDDNLVFTARFYTSLVEGANGQKYIDRDAHKTIVFNYDAKTNLYTTNCTLSTKKQRSLFNGQYIGHDHINPYHSLKWDEFDSYLIYTTCVGNVIRFIAADESLYMPK